MHAGKRYHFFEFVRWTRRDIYKLGVLSVLPTIMYELLGWHWLAIPWVPIALVGTASAFIVGFRNNATYARSWEARQIWGGIVNSSRTWGVMVRDVINQNKQLDEATAKEEGRKLMHRHIAWLTALRHQLREPRAWENMDKPHNREYAQYFHVPERAVTMAEDLQKIMDAQEMAYVLSKSNRATQIMALQSAHIRKLREAGTIDEYTYLTLEGVIKDFYDHQGKCERIKNFPYPRQFASINLFFVRLFVYLVPLGLLNEFQKLGPHMVWLTVPFGILVTWVFHSMERVGEATENPFEGGSNDVPISTLSRTIEIDLRELFDEEEIPKPLQPSGSIVM